MRALFVLAVVSLLIATAQGEPPRVTGRYEPAPPIRTVEPRELWRVTDEEAGGAILGQITDAAVDAAGVSYLLDKSYTTVRVYDPSGRSLGTLGRAGEGPGEFSNPAGCLALADGRLGVMQLLPARIVTFQRDGNPGAEIVPPGTGAFEILESAQAVGDALYLCTHCMIMEGEAPRSVVRLRSLALDGTLRTMFKEQSQAVGKNGLFTTQAADGSDFTECWAAGADGRICIAPRPDAYEIEVYTPEGALERVITLAYERVKQSAEERKALAAEHASLFGSAESGSKVPWLRDIESLHPRADGTLWVASSRGAHDRPAGSVGAFDLLDREGRLAGRIALAADYDAARDEVVIRGDRLYVFKEARMAPITAARAGGDGQAVVVTAGRSSPGGGDDDTLPSYAVICYDLSGI